MARKIVGITCSTSAATEKSGPQQRLNRAYAWAIEQAGGVPLILPVLKDAEGVDRYLGVVDGLLFSGGVDVAPSYYHQEPHPQLGEVDAGRDATEIPLLQKAVAQDMPIFGICRGIQSLNVALGGTLYQDLPSQFPSEIAHQQGDNAIPRNCPSHSIRIAPESRLRAIIGAEEMPVNSFHHQALWDVAPGLVVTATAPDGVIEAVEGPSKRYLLAVQFHPEEMAPVDENARKLFEAFVAAL